MEAPISVQHLTRTYGRRRGVVDLTLEVHEGEIFGFLGPNGAGKTTTIRQLMGLLRPTQGTARIFGLDCWLDSPKVKQSVGFIPGELHFYENMTARGFLDFFASFRRTSHPDRVKRLTERLELDLGPRIKQLSKGNRQKLAIVQAFMHDAPLLILDEPSSGLDPLMQVSFMDLLREERGRGKTVFLSSHQLPEVERIADRVAIIREGRLVAIEAVEQLKQLAERRMEVTLCDPASPAVFAAVPGVRVLAVEQQGRHIHLGVRGRLGPLLHTLDALPVDDLLYGPPDLESIFLHYYHEQQAPARELVEAAS